MTTTNNKISRSAKILFGLISFVFVSVGALAFFTEYSPQKSTRFGLVGPFYGPEAMDIGILTMMIGLMPLIVFARTAKQAAILGTILGVGFIAVLFYLIYL